MKGEKWTYTNKVDVWAIGCILYEVIFRQKLFSADFAVLQYSLGQDLPLPSMLDTVPDSASSAFISTLIYEMLDIDPNKRPRAEVINKRFVSFRVDTWSPSRSTISSLLNYDSTDSELNNRHGQTKFKNGITLLSNSDLFSSRRK